MAGPGRGKGVTLYDQNGRPFNASAYVERERLRSPWNSSGHGRRNRAWYPTSSHTNSMLGGDVETIRRRAHDAVRNSPWALQGSESYVANVVGNGIVPRPLTDDDDFRRELLEAWDEFVEECDADGVQSFYGQQALVVRAMREGGDCFVRLRPRRASDGLSVPLQLQVLEAEMLDPAYNEQLGQIRIHAGVEFDALGRRVAYHLFREHPGEHVNFRRTFGSLRVRVRSENVLHVFQQTRPGQIRGVPGLAPALAKLFDLEQYDDAEVLRKKIAAMWVAFVSRPNELSDPLGAGKQGSSGGDEGLDDDDVRLAALESGTIQELDPGEEIKFNDPSDVGQQYEPFMRMQLRQLAAACGVTYEQLTSDLTGVNYSSIRAGLIEMRRRWKQFQEHVVIFQLCRPVWRRFFEAAVLSGRVRIPSGYRGPLSRLMRVKWTPTPGYEYVDPEKEVRAIVAAIRAGLMSRSEAVSLYGFDAEELDREIAADNTRADQLGLDFDSDPRGDKDGNARASAVAPGKPEPKPEGDDDEEDD